MPGNFIANLRRPKRLGELFRGGEEGDLHGGSEEVGGIIRVEIAQRSDAPQRREKSTIEK